MWKKKKYFLKKVKKLLFLRKKRCINTIESILKDN